MAEQMSKMPQPSNSGSSLEGNNVQRITSPNISASKANFRLEVPEPKKHNPVTFEQPTKSRQQLEIKNQPEKSSIKATNPARSYNQNNSSNQPSSGGGNRTNNNVNRPPR